MPRLIEPVVPPGSMSQLAQPNLEMDARSYLRPWNLHDVSVVVQAYRNPEIQWWMQHSYDEAEARQVITRWNEGWQKETGVCCAIARQTDDAAFGRIALQNVDFIGGSADLVYWLLPESRGQGFAPLATGAVGEWALNRLGLHRLQLFHSVRNPASCRVAVKSGFELDATLRSLDLYRDGWHDTHLHSLMRR